MKKKIILMCLVALALVGCGKDSLTCIITSPQNSEQFFTDKDITVSVLADDKRGSIVEVQLYIDNAGHSSITQFPYNFTINAGQLTAGTHTIKAVAKNNKGTTAESSVSINVTAANKPPTCSITSPQNNAQFKIYDVFTIKISAKDEDGSISYLQVYAGNEKLHSEYYPKFPCNLTAYISKAGTYQLKAIVSDNDGAETSAVITIKINSFVVGESACGGVVAYIDNSTMIVAAQSDLTGTYTWSNAGYTCEALNLNGYTGWRLPNLEEAYILYQNRNLIGGFTANRYWTRSEYSYSNAACMDFSEGTHYNVAKSNSYRVRPIRVHYGFGK